MPQDTFPQGSIETGRTAIIKIKPDAETKMEVKLNGVTNLEALDTINVLVKHFSEQVLADAKADGVPDTSEALDAWMNKQRNL